MPRTLRPDQFRITLHPDGNIIDGETFIKMLKLDLTLCSVEVDADECLYILQDGKSHFYAIPLFWEQIHPTK